MVQIGQQKPGQVQNQQKPMKPSTLQNKQPNPQIGGGQLVKKKSKWWLWLIIALVVVGIAAVVYFLFFR